MVLKYFEKTRTSSGNKIILEEKVLSIKTDENMVRIREECDKYFSETFTKKQAIELFEEAISWIKLNA